MKIRNPNPEIRKKSEFPKSEGLFFVIRVSDFFRISGIRISDFER